MSQNYITAPELKELVDKHEVEVVDARDAHDFEHNHIPGAVNVPFDDDFVKHLTEIYQDKDTTIVIHVEMAESEKYGEPYKELVKLGYTNVKLLKDGFRAWLDQGFPLEFGGGS